MVVSAVENTGEVPSFADRVGERLVVAQPSGALLEFLHFDDELSSTTFFEPAVKGRLKRLSNFRHPSYARATRLQRDASRGGRLTLVSAYAPGRRLADVLVLARRGRIVPRLSAVLSLTRQLMTGAALLHDYAPDVFHGALGPERLVVGSDGRLTITEYVLGEAVERAVAEWGHARLWREYRLGTLADGSLPRYGRRTDLLQIGLVALSLLLGRPLSAAEFPGGLAELLEQARETTGDGDSAPLRPSLKEWLGRLLHLEPSTAFKTLVEAQKAFNRMADEEAWCEASSAAVETLFQQCEEAALLPVAPPESGAVLSAGHEGQASGPQPETPPPVQPPAARADTESMEAPPDAHVLPRESSPAEELLAVPQQPEPASIAPDPFTPWPVVVGSETVATLFDTFKPQTTRESHAVAVPESGLPDAPTAGEALVALPAVPQASHPPGEAGAGRPAPPRRATDRPQTLFESVPLPPIDGHAPAIEPILAPVPGDTRAALPASRPSGAVTAAGERRAPVVLSYDEVHKPVAKRRSPVFAVSLALAVVIVAVAAIAAPRLWSRLRPAASAAPVPPAASAKGSEIGGFRITTQPAGSRVIVDGKLRGKAPLTVADLAPGLHSITVESAWGNVDEAVTVEAGKVLPLALATVGWIKIGATVELHVSEQGKSYGTTGNGALMVPAGRHHFDLVNQALAVRLRQFVDVPPGAVVNVPVELPAGTLNLNSDHPAQVLLDGQVIGDTPLVSVPAPLGAHEVIFRSQKYGEVAYTVNVTLAAPVRVTVNFANKR